MINGKLFHVNVSQIYECWGSRLQVTISRLTRKPNGDNVRDNWLDTDLIDYDHEM